MEYTEMQKKGFEIAKRYEHTTIQARLNIIAKTFGCKTASLETSLCTGKYRGCSDISISFDNGASLYLGTRRTPQAKTVKVQSEYVNDALARYHPEIVSELKALATHALSQREAADNAVAVQKGLKPYSFQNVELGDATEQAGRHLGWYYVTIIVDDKIFGHVETGLNYDIARGEVSEHISSRNYFTAGALKDNDVDYVFDNVGHSSFSGLYKTDLSAEARERAKKTLEQKQRGTYVLPELPPARTAIPDKPIPQGDQLSLVPHAGYEKPSVMDKLSAAKAEVAQKDAAGPIPDKAADKSHGDEL